MSQRTTDAVSYTHLDVYKRQVQMHLVNRLDQLLFNPEKFLTRKSLSLATLKFICKYEIHLILAITRKRFLALKHDTEKSETLH